MDRVELIRAFVVSDYHQIQVSGFAIQNPRWWEKHFYRNGFPQGLSFASKNSSDDFFEDFAANRIIFGALAQGTARPPLFPAVGQFTLTPGNFSRVMIDTYHFDRSNNSCTPYRVTSWKEIETLSELHIKPESLTPNQLSALSARVGVLRNGRFEYVPFEQFRA